MRGNLKEAKKNSNNFLRLMLMKRQNALLNKTQMKSVSKITLMEQVMLLSFLDKVHLINLFILSEGIMKILTFLQTQKIRWALLVSMTTDDSFTLLMER